MLLSRQYSLFYTVCGSLGHIIYIRTRDMLLQQKHKQELLECNFLDELIFLSVSL